MISGGNEKSTSVYSYDCNVANGGWKELNSLNIGRDSHVMSCVNDVIICAGNDFLVQLFQSFEVCCVLTRLFRDVFALSFCLDS